jgi:hypothetical protein
MTNLQALQQPQALYGADGYQVSETDCCISTPVLTLRVLSVKSMWFERISAR